MRAKLIVEGKEFDIDIFDPELQELVATEKHTGYERVKEEELYFYPSLNGAYINSDQEYYGWMSNGLYDGANYYSSKEIAENNDRADRLMRQLRRYSVEHRSKELDWRDKNQKKWCISFYNEDYEELESVDTTEVMHPFSIYFDSKEICELAILQYRNELIWYFTEYKDSL